MSRTIVKLCGFRSVETVKALRGLPIDYIGFVFASSKRQVTPQEALAMAQSRAVTADGRLPQTVGVFVNPSISELSEVLRVVALDVIQLHGQESPEFCRKVKETFDNIQLFKVLPVPQEDAKAAGGNGEAAAAAAAEPYSGLIDALMLDTLAAGASGGTGKTFRWSVIPDYAAWAERTGIPLIAAGGLNADNVAELLNRYRPHGVDVSSGVETDGVKDMKKIEAFVERVKQHDDEHA
jgi:phosphoribosylanthranilate isomerase